MYTYHQKPLCVLFISIAVIVYLSSLKKSNLKNGKTVKSDFTSKTNASNNNFGDLEFYYENISEEIENFETIKILDVLKTVKNTTETKMNKIKLYVLGLFELTTVYGKRPEGFQELKAAQTAIEHVNFLNVLPGYELVLLVNDTKCDPGVALDRIFHAVYSQHTILMLLGAECSNVSETLAHVVPHWNILQVSYGSTSPSLSDRTKFPLFFRTVAPDSTHNLAKVRLIKEFGWHVVATFSQSEESYLLPVNHFITELEKENVSCLASITFSLDNYKEQLSVLKDMDVRIIIGSFSVEMAFKIFCHAYELNMYGSEYVWILQQNENEWWNLSKSECDNEKIIKAVNGVFTTSEHDYISYNGNLNESSIGKLLNSESEELMSKYVWQTYDAVWTIALCLKRSNIDFLEKFHYGRVDMVGDFMKKMRQMTFIGLSGPIKFNGPDRIGDLVINQIQDGRLIRVALFDSLKNCLNFSCLFCQEVSWQDGQRVPLAQRILKVRLITISKTMYGIVASVTLLGILVAFAFLYFNLRFRRMKTLKISSPKLNSLAVTGCILVYISVILFRITDVMPEAKLFFSEICSVQIYLISAGFCLAFGSMFAKCYRVHRLFLNSAASLVRDKLLKDNHMIALILIPLVVDAIIMILWVNINPLERHLYNLVLEISPEDRGVVYQPQVELCLCHNTMGWYVALFGYKGLIVIMGVYMAWKTRNIKVPVLNDSQYIGVCVYSAVFCTIIVVLFSLIKEYVLISYLARNISILTTTTVTMILLFLPKLKSVFSKVDTEESIMQSLGLKIEYKTRRFLLDDPTELIHRLEIQNRIHLSRLESLDRKIFYLEDLVSQFSPSFSQSLGVPEVLTDLHCLSAPHVNIRASWPNAYFNKIKPFASERKLVNDRIPEKFNLFGRLRNFLGSFKSLQNVEHTEKFVKKKERREFGSITF